MDIDYEPYLGWGLNDIEDIIEAFTQYEQGGWWVRKIVYKDAFNREVVLGPYTEENAKKDVREWNSIFKFKGLETASAHSFTDLICQSQERYDYLKEVLFEEYIWKPPKGSEVFCLIYGDKKVVMIKKNKILKKIKTYISTKNIDFIESDKYDIFYKEKNILSLLQARKLKKLTEDYKEYPAELSNLYNYAIKNTYNKPAVLPGYIKDFDEVPKTFRLSYFKKFEKYNLNSILEEIKKEAERVDIYSYNLAILYNKNDVDIKNVILNVKDNKIKITFKDFKLEGNSSKTLIADISYKRYDKKIFSLLIYLAKVFKLEMVKTKDIMEEYCDTYPLYINIVRFLDNKDSIFSELDFVEQNLEKRKEVISNFSNKTVGELDKYKYEEDDIFSQKYIRDIAKEYLDNNMRDRCYCYILNSVSLEIFRLYKNCIFEYYLNLEDYSLSSLFNKFD